MIKDKLLKKEKKVTMLYLILPGIFMLIGTSFALWQITLKQKNTNTITTTCFKLNFKETDGINLQNAYPITDTDGLNLTPYTFTVENICNTMAFYQINLEELNNYEKRLDNNYIKVSLNKSKGKILNTYTSVDTTLDNTDISHKLTTGTLKANETKDFELRLWLSNDTPLNNDTINATFESKITIITVHKKDIENDLKTENRSLTETYTNTEEIIEFKVTSRDYDIIEYSEDNIIFNPVDTPAKEIILQKAYQTDGTYTMYFKDEVGNITKSTVETTKLDKVSPSMIYNIYEKNDGIKIDLSKATDNKSGIKKYYYKLNDNEFYESTESIHTFTGLPDGKYKITVKIEDNAGNTDEIVEEVVVAYEKVYISNTGNDNFGNGSLESPYASLQSAYNKVKSGGEILLLSDITTINTTNMNIDNKNVTLKSDNQNIFSITKLNDLKTEILNITESNTITITNIILDGNNITSTRPLISVGYQSTINLNENTIVKNNINTSLGYPSGINIYQSSTCNINGATITNNKSTGVLDITGGIQVNSNSNLVLNSGEISHNSTSGHGGGIYLMEATFEMNGGAIMYNTSSDWGGGIAISCTNKNSTFIMNNGTISNNSASNWAGGLGLYHNLTSQSGKATAYLKGGTINNNTAPDGPNTRPANGAQIIYN